MRKVLCLLAFSAMAFADSWSGKLLDAGCYDKDQKAAGCNATSDTTSFALQVADKVYKLDTAGNEKAAAALKEKASHATDPSKPQSTEIMAKVEGSEQNGVIAAETVEVP